jgi:hypothetical protein
MIGVPYNQQITASPAGTYVFSVVSGTLSGTLTLSPTGLLSGTPTTAGIVIIRATEGTTGCSADIPLTIGAFVSPGIPTLSGWGLLTLMALLGLVSVYLIRRTSGS